MKYYFGIIGWLLGHADKTWWGLAGFICGFAIYDVACWVYKRLAPN
ncbi:hypothetical protein M2428_000608 [Arthrobacter sp. ES3-54]|nr:hypothetical protein [Arthrobacter sp. ES3-54]